MIRFKLRDEEHAFDDDSLTLEELWFIKEKTGLGLRDFMLGLREFDGHAVGALLYLTLQRESKVDRTVVRPRWEDIGQIDVLRDFEGLGGDDEADDEAESTEDPTVQTST